MVTNYIAVVVVVKYRYSRCIFLVMRKSNVRMFCNTEQNLYYFYKYQLILKELFTIVYLNPLLAASLRAGGRICS